jgi:uncharacterized protein (TIGR03067 family)
MKKVVLLVLVVGLLLGADKKKDLVKKEMKKLQGKWTVGSISKGNEERGGKGLGPIRFTVNGKCQFSKLPFLGKGGKGTFTLDPTKKPKRIDITIGGKTRKGIYEFTEDGLTLALNPKAGDPAYPKGFEIGSKDIQVELIKPLGRCLSETLR